MPKVEDRKENWMQAISRHRSKIEGLGIPVPEIKEIGVAGLDVKVKKGDQIVATPL